MIEKDEQIISVIKKERASLFCVFSSKCRFSSPLIDLVNCQGGAQPPKSMHIYKPKNGYVRFVQNRDYSDSNHLTFIPISKRNKMCDKTDIMIDKYGEAGMVRYGITGAFNVALMKVSEKNPEQKEYLRDFLLQKTIRKMLSQSSMASTRNSLNEGTFKGVSVPLLGKNDMMLYQERGTTLLNIELKLRDEVISLNTLKKHLLEKFFGSR